MRKALALTLLLTLNAPAIAENDEFRGYFVGLLRAHGESKIINDKSGIGLKGNPTRVSARIINTEQLDKKRCSVEMEFRVKLSADKEIVDNMAGLGSDQRTAELACFKNFTQSTFHPVYKTFMNPSDAHQKLKSFTSQGKVRKVAVGEPFVLKASSEKDPNLFQVEERIRSVVLAQPLDAGPHWIKVVFGQTADGPLRDSCVVMLDNRGSAGMTAKLRKMSWPPAKFYLYKQSIVIR